MFVLVYVMILSYIAQLELSPSPKYEGLSRSYSRTPQGQNHLGGRSRLWTVYMGKLEWLTFNRNALLLRNQIGRRGHIAILKPLHTDALLRFCMRELV